eukprot:jgi/Undpi1/4193/HiC_scaffold_16.g07560.m1
MTEIKATLKRNTRVPENAMRVPYIGRFIAASLHGSDLTLKVRELSEAKLAAAVDMEAASYPPDEAASPEGMRSRRANAGAFFLEATLKNGIHAGEMVSMVCGTCCQGSELTHESMEGHDPDGPTLCIHTVVVAESHRRKGYARTMLKAYLENVALTQPGVRRVCLITKARLLGMYASCGFALKGLSPVVHGKDPWFEMAIDLDATEPRLLRFLQVDAFSERKFEGNPAAVFFTQAGGDADWMQKVAIEMNLSESCFLELKPDSLGEDSEGPMYALRWFTPGGEVNLCGHATLAAASALWGEGMVDTTTAIRFSTASGVLTCRRDGEGWVEMDFPAKVVGGPLPSTDERRRAIEEALRLSGDALFVGRNNNDIMVEVTPQAFDALNPDMRMLAAIDTRGFIVTCEAESGEGDMDYLTRFFAPRMGIDEDPVTGSAHCCLAPYWASKLGRDSLKGYQASTRGGTIRATVCRGKGEGRVLLKGKAVTKQSLEGIWEIQPQQGKREEKGISCGKAGEPPAVAAAVAGSAATAAHAAGRSWRERAGEEEKGARTTEALPPPPLPPSQQQ